MTFNWEKFEQGPVESYADRIHVTLNSRGNFFLNRRAIEAIGDPECVSLMFDRRRKTIGIQSASASGRGAYRLRMKDRKSSGSRNLYASNFCRYYSIRPAKTFRFIAAEVDKDGILILNLNEARPVGK